MKTPDEQHLAPRLVFAESAQVHLATRRFRFPKSFRILSLRLTAATALGVRCDLGSKALMQAAHLQGRRLQAWSTQPAVAATGLPLTTARSPALAQGLATIPSSSVWKCPRRRCNSEGNKAAAIVNDPQQQLSARQSHHGQRVPCPVPFRTQPTDPPDHHPTRYGATYRGILKHQEALEQGQTPGYLTPPLDLPQGTLLVLPEPDHLILEHSRPGRSLS